MSARAAKAVIRTGLLRVAWLSWGALTLLVLLGGLLLHEYYQAPLLPMMVRLLPLLLIVPALFASRPKGYFWLAFIGLLGAGQGAALLRLPVLWWLAGMEILAGLILAVTALCIARQLRRQGLDSVSRER